METSERLPATHVAAAPDRAIGRLPCARGPALASLVFAASLCTPLGASAQAQAEAQTPVEAGRSLTSRFAATLQAALLSAMREGGPAAAIAVCRDEAPRIASALSRESGAKVERTSLGFRNPANAPEPWQADVLRDFDRNSALAARPEGLEHTEVGPDMSVRYMKAIPAAGLCLVCHGTEIPAEVEAALAEHYPHDLARGYSAADVRGAFSITWPATTAGR